jgi:drug/metabolite transporter (DMT)-like permease
MITATTEPMIAGVLAYFFLGEKLSLAQLFGAVLVILAIAALQIVREENLLSPEVIRDRN